MSGPSAATVVARSCSKGSRGSGPSPRTACGTDAGQGTGPRCLLARSQSLVRLGTAARAGLAVACGRCDPRAVIDAPEPTMVTVRPGSLMSRVTTATMPPLQTKCK
jgi:hypothetical protein